MIHYATNDPQHSLLDSTFHKTLVWQICTVCFQICIDYLLSVLSWLLLSVGLRAPANVVAKVETCNTVTLQWDQPSEPDDITTSVSCTPHSPGCAECTTSPCTITGLNPSTEYEFTVTLDSVMCGTSMNTAGIGTRGKIKCVKRKIGQHTTMLNIAICLLLC